MLHTKWWKSEVLFFYFVSDTTRDYFLYLNKEDVGNFSFFPKKSWTNPMVELIELSQ
jgi:hypothetical protein